MLFLPYKVLGKIGESIEHGCFFTSNFFIRKEIWNQANAKINGLHQKYEAYKAISEKIDNLRILSEKNVINFENLNKFCDFLVEVQNTFSKEFDYIKPFNNNDLNNQNPFYKKFLEISNKIKNNLLIARLLSKPDFIETMHKLINSTKNLVTILDNFKTKPEEQKHLRDCKVLISGFFYNTILKLAMTDMRELSLRFFEQKIIEF